MAEMIKISTWNVNSLRIRMPHVVRFVAESGADILCFQETKTEDATFPAAELEALGFHLAVYGQKSYNGVAIASRFPLSDIRRGFGAFAVTDDLAAQARYISATAETPAGALRVASVYVPQGETLESPKFAFKQAFYEQLPRVAAAEQALVPAYVLAGDFNIATDERDVVDAKKAAKAVMFTPQERTWLTGLRQQAGLTDTFRAISDEAHVYSWFDYRTYARSPQNGMRIDYLFCSPALAPHIRGVDHAVAERAQTQPSDHVPVTLSLDLAAASAAL